MVIFLFELAYFSHLDPSFDFNGLPFSDEGRKLKTAIGIGTAIAGDDTEL